MKRINGRLSQKSGFQVTKVRYKNYTLIISLLQSVFLAICAYES